ncbi:MAG: hypothetical protein WC506_01925 [Candidatus Micrarchaeia archaeon]
MEIPGKGVKGFIFSALAVLAIAAVLAPYLLHPAGDFQASPAPAYQAREAAKALGGAVFSPAVSGDNGTSVYVIGPYLSDTASSAGFISLLAISGKSGSYNAYFGPVFYFKGADAAGQFEFSNLGKAASFSYPKQFLEKITVENCQGCRIDYSPNELAPSQLYNFTLEAGGRQEQVGMPFIGTVSVRRGNESVLELSYLDYSGTVQVSGPAMASAYFQFRVPQDMLIYPQKTIVDNGVPAWVSD